jgi:integrase/recombinase XerD
MRNFTELASARSDQPAPFADQLRLAVAAYLARFGLLPHAHRERPALLPVLVRSAGPGPADRTPPAPKAAHPVDAGDPPVQALHRVPAVLGHRRVLPDLRHRRHLEHSPAEHVRRPAVPAESPTLGFTHLPFEALLTAARQSANLCDFALVAMPGLLGLRIFEATGANITDLGEQHGHRALRVSGKGTKVALIPLPPAAGKAIDQAIGDRVGGPILRNRRGARMDRHAATRRPRRLAAGAGLPIARPHPHMLRHTFATTMLDAGVDPRDAQIAARHADPRTTMRYDRARTNHDRHPNYILAPTWPPAPDRACVSRGSSPREPSGIAE